MKSFFSGNMLGVDFIYLCVVPVFNLNILVYSNYFEGSVMQCHPNEATEVLLLSDDMH